MDSPIATSAIKEFNKLAQQATIAAQESVEAIWRAGELAAQAKDSLKHGEWSKFVAAHYVIHLNTVDKWVKFYDNFDFDEIHTLPSMTAGLKMLPPPAKPEPESDETESEDAETDSDAEQEDDSQESEDADTESTDAQGDDEEDSDEDDWIEEDETIEECCARESKEIDDWARQLVALGKEAHDAMEGIPTLDALGVRTGWLRKLKEAVDTLRGAKPRKCPVCDGDNPDCICKENGRVTRQQYKQMVN